MAGSKRRLRDQGPFPAAVAATARRKGATVPGACRARRVPARRTAAQAPTPTDDSGATRWSASPGRQATNRQEMRPGRARSGGRCVLATGSSSHETRRLHPVAFHPGARHRPLQRRRSPDGLDHHPTRATRPTTESLRSRGHARQPLPAGATRLHASHGERRRGRADRQVCSDRTPERRLRACGLRAGTSREPGCSCPSRAGESARHDWADPEGQPSHRTAHRRCGRRRAFIRQAAYDSSRRATGKGS